MPSTDNELLTVEEVAEILHLSPRGVRHRAKAGTLPSTKLAGRTGAYIFHRSEIERVRKEMAGKA